MSTTTIEGTQRREFEIVVLGRTLEHLGVQMYKRRDVAIAELVANSWDAGANSVYVKVPEEDEYDQIESDITVADDGVGMDADKVQDQYLVVGRNRRRAGDLPSQNRPVMGRKGIGKLAGFGIAQKMTVVTWRSGTSTTFTLDVQQLKGKDGQAKPVPIDGFLGPVPPDVDTVTGTRVLLQNLKHKTPLDVDKLREALGRRFSRRVRGEMRIYVNGEEVTEPELDLEQRFPEEGYHQQAFPNGDKVSYYYAFSKTVIRSPQLRGFTIYVRGKTAQAPPFFFNVEGTASGQHGTRYLTGVINADFLDSGTDDESDLISTDRQEIDWEDERAHKLYEWGQELTRKALREWAARKGRKMENRVLEDEGLRARIQNLDGPLRDQVSGFLRQLGSSDADPERSLELADSLVRAYEYRHFSDVVRQIEDVGEDPDQLHLLLSYLSQWKVMESRAILEIVKGRLDIVQKFHEMIVNDAPETAPHVGDDNMHDLIAGYPWLLNPEWQVLSEETGISTQLKEWGAADLVGEKDKGMRYDFLALSDERRLIVVEIKRSGHNVSLEELYRLETYKDRLARAQNKDMYMVMVAGEITGVSEDTLRAWKNRPDGEIRTWNDVYSRTFNYYEHYRAVLEGNVDHDNFFRKQREIAQTRRVIDTGSTYRGPSGRREGLGPQDSEGYVEGDSPEVE